MEFKEKANKTADDKAAFLLYFYNNYQFEGYVGKYDDKNSFTIQKLSISFGDIMIEYDASGYVEKDGVRVPHSEVYPPDVKISTKKVFDFSLIEKFKGEVALELIPEDELAHVSLRQELKEKYKDYDFTILP